MKMEIQALLPPMDDNGANTLVIATNKDGSFNIGQMYDALSRDADSILRKV